jgi:hypothetical protein
VFSPFKSPLFGEAMKNQLHKNLARKPDQNENNGLSQFGHLKSVCFMNLLGIVCPNPDKPENA